MEGEDSTLGDEEGDEMVTGIGQRHHAARQ